MVRVFLQLSRDGKQCRGSCWEDDDHQPLLLPDVRLGPEDTIEIPGLDPPHSPCPYTLQQLVDALIAFNPHDLHALYEERGQVTLGKYLWDQTLGRLGRYTTATDVDLRICAQDEHLAGLPWPLLMRGEAFVTSADWTISLVTRPGGLKAAELPPGPRVLMIAPEPADAGSTTWYEHHAELKHMLQEGGPQLAAEDHFRCVHTWQEFSQAVRSAEWDAIYYYGHGLGDRNQSRLVFQDDEGQRLIKAMSDVADQLRRARRPPSIVYVNCCQGDAGGLIGAGQQLSAIAPAVITNRTVATVAAARAQACAFWRQVLLHGVAPERAAARNYQQLGDIGLDRIKPYWFTPVVYAHYSQWLSHPPRQLARHDYDPHWKVKLDRRDQFAVLSLQVRDMILEGKPRTAAFVWYGEAGQGIHLFHERIEVELPKHVPGKAIVHCYNPRWPEFAEDSGPPELAHRLYEEKLWEAFQVDHLSRICARVRRDAGHGQAVVVLNFPPVIAREKSAVRVEMDPPRLCRYLRWWDEHVVPQLEDKNHWFVLAFSFQPLDCVKFQAGLKRCGLNRELRHTAATRLPPLECVAREDLLDFLRRHNVYVPPEWLDRYLDAMLRKTDGRYEATLRELEQAVIEGYAQLAEAELADDPPDDDEDMGMG